MARYTQQRELRGRRLFSLPASETFAFFKTSGYYTLHSRNCGAACAQVRAFQAGAALPQGDAADETSPGAGCGRGDSERRVAPARLQKAGFLQGCFQRVDGDRLDQDIAGAALHGALAGLRLVVGGADKDRHLRQARFAPDKA